MGVEQSAQHSCMQTVHRILALLLAAIMDYSYRVHSLINGASRRPWALDVPIALARETSPVVPPSFMALKGHARLDPVTLRATCIHGMRTGKNEAGRQSRAEKGGGWRR